MIINSLLEHTNLSPSLTDQHIYQLVEDADLYKFRGICVPPFWVKKAAREIGTKPIELITVAGFPLGYNMTETKLGEINLSLKDGATEIDLVMNISAFKAGMSWAKIEIAKAASIIHSHEKILKVIIETSLLTKEEIEKACKLCSEAGADFVKTSTGFGSGGANVADIQLMRSVLPKEVRIKASGGIKSFDVALDLIKAGADTIGSSSSVAIVKESKGV